MKSSSENLHSSRNSLNPKKLRNSKWTSINPVNKEKHFVVTTVKYDENGAITCCLIEAVCSGRSIAIEWRELGNSEEWVIGWR